MQEQQQAIGLAAERGEAGTELAAIGFEGLVGANADQSFANLERIAGPGMQAMDGEILRIMQDKLR